jgi:formylglycine-generating enzyme
MNCVGWKSFPILSAVALLALGLEGRETLGNVFDLQVTGETNLSFVTIGDAGNKADANGYGAVAYSFEMSTYDITVSQYTAMLNAIAQTDPMGLFNSSMNPENNPASCGIVRSGTAGNYTYSYASANANFPVNAISWGDCARFCNWLANGQPDTGVENASTTEDGSYSLNGALTDEQLDSVTRSLTATYVIPSENEWCKASYYKSGSTNAGYWLYPTRSDTPPSNVLSMTGTNNANFYDPNLGFSDPTNFLTPVGAFAGSPGPYGTFDMGGDVLQWTEGLSGSERVDAGGAFNGVYTYLQAGSAFSGTPPSTVELVLGFRIVEVPEPGSLLVLTIGAVGLFTRNRRR